MKYAFFFIHRDEKTVMGVLNIFELKFNTRNINLVTATMLLQ